MVVNSRLRARIGDGKKFNIYSKLFETAAVRNLLQFFFQFSRRYTKRNNRE